MAVYKMRLIYLTSCLLLFGCKGKIPIPYVPNDPPKSEFSFEFSGRLEKLEDAFYSMELNYKERPFRSFLQKTPEYEFQIRRNDTIVNYVATLEDCQSIYYLVKWNDNWNCNSSNVHILEYAANVDSLPAEMAKSFFKEEIINKVFEKFRVLPDDYHWKVEKHSDTTFVNILNQNDSLRKTYVYSFDSVGHSIEEKKIINYLGDSTIIYEKDPNQRFMYLASKKVIRKE